ncbi:M20/M25/M40 family metallo-hydrolase [Longitalea arenae]|uniref:M20/M25/M40 family metallo-hydrolase n=1 Tax=Longitalea arenae TaxID=2812558 RepID=UPI001966DC85|nr:M20/M25/M40 family metallo-hydrolase [Longitalea arenae]
MQYCYTRLSLILLLSWNITICSAQSKSIDSIITPSSLKEMVQQLSADSFQGRLTGTVHASRAALYISSAFERAGALPIAGNDGYIMPFTIDDKATAFNVVAALPGRSKAGELVIFSAHYDHIGTKDHTIPYHVPERGKPEKEDKIYNGANDNASGISGLIHLARYFAQVPGRERTIIFIAFSGEEEGLLGSKHLAEAFDPKVVTAMVNMDMIGRPISEDNKYPYITGEEQSNLQALLNKRLYELAPEYGERYFRPDRFRQESLYARSDNYPFAKRGIIAHTIITSSPVDKYYHSLNDEWETLDYPFLAEVVKAIALATTGLATGLDKPEK